MFWHYSSNISPESHFPLQSGIYLTHSSPVASKIGLPGSWTSPLLSWFFWQKKWSYEIRVLLQTKFKRHLPTLGLLAFMASIFQWLYNTSLWVSIIKAVWRVKQAIPRGIWADVRVMPHSKWHQTMIAPGHDKCFSSTESVSCLHIKISTRFISVTIFLWPEISIDSFIHAFIENLKPRG